MRAARLRQRRGAVGRHRSLLALVTGVVRVHLVRPVVRGRLSEGVGVAGVPVRAVLVGGVVGIQLVGPVVGRLLAHLLSGRHC